MYWTLICNNNRFDLIKHFESNSSIIWKQNKDVIVGDLAFFYLSAPYGCIKFACKVLETNIHDKKRVLPFYLENKPEDNNEKDVTVCSYMELKLLHSFDSKDLARNVLINHGMNSFQKSSRAPSSLTAFLNKMIVERNISI